MYHSNIKTLSQKDKGTNKIVFEEKNPEFLAIVENCKFLDKFDPNRAIDQTDKGTDNSLEGLFPELQILKGMGKYSSKMHSSKRIG